ncbi:4863_t:CDS:2 [Rhizophagus irregularis]|nr:4863_t:CDS:2 [Rhizophagus irregularis]
MKQAKKTLTKKSDLGKKKADQIHSDCFFEEVIKNMDDNPNENDDPVEKMCKPSKRINSYTISDESFSESSSNDDDATSSKDKLETNALVHGEEIAFKSSKSESSSSSNSESEEECSKKHKKTSSKKTSKISPLSLHFTKKALMVDSFVCAQLKKVSINTWNMINAEFIDLKDLILSYYVSNFSEKECEKFWNGITIVFTQILQPITNLV